VKSGRKKDWRRGEKRQKSIEVIILFSITKVLI
jgi:hypothetical protein